MTNSGINMKDNDLALVECSKNVISPDSVKTQTRTALATGNVIWIQDDGTWWPAQVVDERHEVGSKKVQKKKVGKVFVRLYGSYEYLHVDPSKYNSKFENVLKAHNHSWKDVFLKSLEKERSLLNSEDEQASDNAEDTVPKACIDNDLKKKGIRNDQYLSDNIKPKGDLSLRTPKRSKIQSEVGKGNVTSNQQNGRSKTLSRSTKMMQMLGLVAPTDSPFRKNGPKPTISVQL